MKNVTRLALGLLLAGFTYQASAFARHDAAHLPGDVWEHLPAQMPTFDVPDDPVPVEPDCEELCGNVEDAEEALAAAQTALSDAESNLEQAMTNSEAADAEVFDLEQEHSEAVAELNQLKDAEFIACSPPPTGSPEACTAARAATDVQQTVVNDLRDAVQSAQRAANRAALRVDRANAAVGFAQDDLDRAEADLAEAEAAAEDCNCGE